jgi:5-methylcytosine-specific restriction protein A
VRYCAQPGCTVVVDKGRCAAHSAQREQQRQGADTWRRWYKLPIWRSLRALVLKEEPLCRLCQAADQVTAATEVDHVTPHRGAWALFVDRANLQGLCKPCHSRKTQAGR